MADYYTQFSFMLSCPEGKAKDALALFKEMKCEPDEYSNPQFSGVEAEERAAQATQALKVAAKENNMFRREAAFARQTDFQLLRLERAVKAAALAIAPTWDAFGYAAGAKIADAVIRQLVLISQETRQAVEKHRKEKDKP
jgi:hypothetical protein